MKLKFAILSILLPLTSAFGAEEEVTKEAAKPFFNVIGLSFQDFLAITLLVGVVALTIFILFQVAVIRRQMKLMMKMKESGDKNAVLDEETWTQRTYRKFLGLKPMSMEGELIMDDHEYDGIHELKNGMPPWLQAFFGVTILFAIVYWMYFIVLEKGPNQYEAYQIQMELAEKEKEMRRNQMSFNIDENNVELLMDPSDIASGKNIFIENCATCHKDKGEGDTGPNLTDEYWIHGGGIKNVFKTIKIGYPQNSMPGWEDKLNPLQIQRVASFVISLQGTNPPNAKSPQGELWVAAESDSTATDSLQLPQDSIPEITDTLQ